MAYHDQIAAEGRVAYDANRLTEAALLYRRAALAALEFGDRTAWFKRLVWAAVATYYNGDTQIALALFLEARESEPDDAPQYEAWLARATILNITVSIRPERARLEQILIELRSYATTHLVPAGDLALKEGYFLELLGYWENALAHFEAAWQAHDGKGYLPIMSAAACCLRLGQLSACRDWIAALDKQKGESIPLWSAELTLDLALATGQSFATLLPFLRTYIDRAAGIQSGTEADTGRELIARAYLLDTNAGDPASDFHPTFAELRRFPKARQNVAGRYGDHLLHLDYRLACLRYTADVPAVDDLYYSQPQLVPAHLTLASTDLFRQRLQKAQAAAQRTLRYARQLDTLLECDYRQREVQARNERIDEMARAIELGPTAQINDHA